MSLLLLFAGASSGGAVVLFDATCERTMANLTPLRTMANLTAARTMANTTPTRTVACLED